MTAEVAAEFWQGVAEFNQGEFYACHDTLEALWMEATEPPKSLYQGILQIAVGCYHLGNQNWRGAVILLGEGISRLRKYEPGYAGLNLSQFIDQAAQLLTQLQQAGPERVQEFSSLGMPTENLPPRGAIALEQADLSFEPATAKPPASASFPVLTFVQP